MASSASHSHLRLLTPCPVDARTRPMVPESFFELRSPGSSRHVSGTREIDARESWGSSSGEGSPFPRWKPAWEFGHPDHHEPTANLITLVSCLVMFAAAVWWGGAQLHHDALPKSPVIAAVNEGIPKSGTSGGEPPASP